MTNIVGSVFSCLLVLELKGKPSKLNDRFVVFLRSRDPHHLHLPIFVGQSQVNLLMSRLHCYFYLRNFNQLFQSDLLIPVRVKETMNILNILFGDIMLRLHESEIVHKLLHSCNPIIISIVCRPEETFQIVQTHLS